MKTPQNTKGTSGFQGPFGEKNCIGGACFFHLNSANTQGVLTRGADTCHDLIGFVSSRAKVTSGIFYVYFGCEFSLLAQPSSALCACQIAFVVARCEFWYRSCNHLGALHVSDRSRCGVVLILRSLAQPSRHFGRVRSFPRGGARSCG